MEYLGSVAPFYISRFRLKILSERIDKRSIKLTGKISIPLIGELQIDNQRVDSATGLLLERVINWLSKNNAIGDVSNTNCEYTWISIKGKMIRVESKEEGVDHFFAADTKAISPEGWHCLVVGSRTNLTSLTESKIPFLGSSPIAIQKAIEIFLKTSKSNINIDQKQNIDACSNLKHVGEIISTDPSSLEWPIAGVVEVLFKCPKEKLILVSPLFLTYYSHK